MRRPNLHSLSTAIGGPATEVCLFVAGWNETENGSYLFDGEAARAVMAAFAKHGVDRMFDLEHLSLDPNARNFDPDARGWCRLELRPDGSLWAVNIRWTPDGERRLREGTQRYISPAFEIDPETRRVTKVINVAITAMPATHNTTAIAARLESLSMMDPEKVKAILAALKEGDAESAMAICEALLVDAASGASEEAPAAEPAPAAEAAADAPAAPPAEEDEDEEKDAAMAARVKLCKLSGRETVGEAMADVELWRAAFLNQAAERASVAKSQEKLEADERRGLIAQLIKLGSETPATAWADPLAKSLKPCKRLTSEPIADMRDRVAKLSAGRKPSDPKPPKTAASTNVEVNGVELTETEVQRVTARAEENGTDPKIAIARFAQLKAAQTNQPGMQSRGRVEN